MVCVCVCVRLCFFLFDVSVSVVAGIGRSRRTIPWNWRRTGGCRSGRTCPDHSIRNDVQFIPSNLLNLFSLLNQVLRDLFIETGLVEASNQNRRTGVVLRGMGMREGLETLENLVFPPIVRGGSVSAALEGLLWVSNLLNGFHGVSP